MDSKSTKNKTNKSLCNCFGTAIPGVIRHSFLIKNKILHARLSINRKQEKIQRIILINRKINGSVCQSRRCRLNPFCQGNLQEKETATHFRILAWETPWQWRSLEGCGSWCHKRVRYNLATKQQLIFK